MIDIDKIRKDVENWYYPGVTYGGLDKMRVLQLCDELEEARQLLEDSKQFFPHDVHAANIRLLSEMNTVCEELAAERSAHEETRRVLQKLVEALHSIKSIDSHGTPYYQFFIPQTITASRSAPLDEFVADALAAAEKAI